MPELPSESDCIAEEPTPTGEPSFWDQYLDPIPSPPLWTRWNLRRIGIAALALVVVLGAGVAALFLNASDGTRRAEGGLIPVTATEPETLALAPEDARPSVGNTAGPGAASSRTPAGSPSRSSARVPSGSSGATGPAPAPAAPSGSPTAAPATSTNSSSATPATTTPAATGEVSIFNRAAGNPLEFSEPANLEIELGMRFTASKAGSARGIMFFRLTGNDPAPVGSLWDASGKRIASVTFNASSQTGWLRADFAKPVALTPGEVYTVSYHVTDGIYTAEKNVFTSERTSGPLRAMAASDGGNGVYRYGSSARPTDTFGSPSYFVDIVFAAA